MAQTFHRNTWNKNSTDLIYSKISKPSTCCFRVNANRKEVLIMAIRFYDPSIKQRFWLETLDCPPSHLAKKPGFGGHMCYQKNGSAL